MNAARDIWSEEEPDDPVRVMVARIRRGGAPTRAEVAAVQALLKMWLARRQLEPEDREEVASDAVYRLVVAVEAGRLDFERPPGAWLRVVADHLALDALRRRRRRQGETFDELVHGQVQEDDRIAALLDASAASADVGAAMRRAREAGDFEAVRVIATWLDLVAADGEAPSSRTIGERMGVSHTTVQRALTRFGGLLRP